MNVVLLFVAVASLIFIILNLPTAKQPVVNLQVTEDRNFTSFQQVMGELQKREIKATIITTGDFAKQHCEYMGDLSAKGYEFMAYAIPPKIEITPGIPPTQTIDLLPYEEQKRIISQTKTDIEDCTNKSVKGLRPIRFKQNEDTFKICDELGIRYNSGFSIAEKAYAPGHENDNSPYAVKGHGFIAIPVRSAEINGSYITLCDHPMLASFAPREYERILKSELDKSVQNNETLITEIHTYTITGGAQRYAGTEENWDVFLGFLDYAAAKNAKFVTVEELCPLPITCAE